MISNRGLKVWPDGAPETFCTDHWRARFMAPAEGCAYPKHVLQLLHFLEGAGVDFIKTEGLYRFGGKPGYSLGQGQ
jgi:isocitrate dehydrogenase